MSVVAIRRSAFDWNFEIYDARQRPVLERVRACVDSLKEIIADGRGLIFFGTVGTGKDHLLIALLYEAARLGFSCRYFNGQEIYGQFRDRMDSGQKEDGLLNELEKPDVLAISDPIPPVGAPPATGWELTTVPDDNGFLWLLLLKNGRLVISPASELPFDEWPRVGWQGDLHLLRVGPRRGPFGKLIEGQSYLGKGNVYRVSFEPCACSDPHCHANPWMLNGQNGSRLQWNSRTGRFMEPTTQRQTIDGEEYAMWRDVDLSLFDLELLPEEEPRCG
jgi:hypothetical protein